MVFLTTSRAFSASTSCIASSIYKNAKNSGLVITNHSLPPPARFFCENIIPQKQIKSYILRHFQEKKLTQHELIFYCKIAQALEIYSILWYNVQAEVNFQYMEKRNLTHIYDIIMACLPELAAQLEKPEKEAEKPVEKGQTNSITR